MTFLKFVSIVAFSLTLVGCVSLPDMPRDALETAAVLRHIKCEFRDAVLSSASNAYLRKWATKFTLVLVADEKGDVAVSPTIAHPAAPSFGLPLTGSLSREIKRTQKIHFDESVEETITDAETMKCPQSNDLTPLAGKIGLADIFDKAASAMKEASIEPNELDYDLYFSIVYNATASPKWTLIPLAKKDTLDIGAKWTGNREHDHSLSIVMTPKAARQTCIFTDFYAKYKICPNVVATMEEARGLKSRSSGLATKKGVDAATSQKLDNAAVRSLIQNQNIQLNRLNIPQ